MGTVRTLNFKFYLLLFFFAGGGGGGGGGGGERGSRSYIAVKVHMSIFYVYPISFMRFKIA